MTFATRFHGQASRRTHAAPSLAVLAAASFAAVSPATLPAQAPETPRDQAVQLLSRLAYGPRPGDVERVRAMGERAWIEEQLHPERLADTELDARLARYRVLDMDFDELLAYDAPNARIAVRRRSSALEKGMEPPVAQASSSAGGARARVRSSILNPQVGGRPTESGPPRDNDSYLEIRLLRAVYSERQLYELMVDFWMNHFNILTGDPYLLIDFEENVIRPRALGSFHDLLLATAQHPAMLVYLDNWLSSAPEEEVRARLQGEGEGLVEGALEVRARGAFLDVAKGLNENYARELMELHTVGVDGGYTQADVLQVAKALTGWTIGGWADRQDGDFMFDPALHEGGDKVVMGRRIPEAGMDEGLQILDMLAHHPSTARFVSTKLVRRFVADQPPPEVVEAAARTFMETKGDIREVLRTIFESPDFHAEAGRRSKVKKPIELVASALRAVDARIDTRFQGAVGAIDQTMRRMGEGLYRHEAPDGYPDVADAWISTNALFQRLTFTMDLARGRIPGVTADLDAAEALFAELGYETITAEQVAAAKRMLAEAARGEDADGGMMMAGEMMAADAEPSMAGTEEMAGDAYSMRVVGVASEEAEVTDRRAVAVALLLGSPAFQKR